MNVIGYNCVYSCLQFIVVLCGVTVKLAMSYVTGLTRGAAASQLWAFCSRPAPMEQWSGG